MKINKRGFTLIELLVVIAIIGLLSTLAVVSLNTARVKARDARRMSDLKQVSTAIELYMAENEVYPTNGACGGNGVVAVAETVGPPNDALCGAGNGITDGTNVFLNSIPEDPGSNTYYYEGDTDNYCISATLEGAAFFVCVDGSCYERAADCTEAGA